MTAAVFLDRDGTLNHRPAEHDYVRSQSEFVWTPGAREAVAKLHAAGYTPAVVSNQRGVARGLLDQATLEAIDARIQADLAPYGVEMSAFRYCPHDDEDDCGCRKPKPGMLVDLSVELDLDLERSWMVGDSETDVLAGAAAGCRTVLIARHQTFTTADYAVPSLAAAADLIVSQERQR